MWAEGHWGHIIGHNSSANLDVLTDNGVVLNCHPTFSFRYFADDGSEVARFERGVATLPLPIISQP